MLVAVAKLGARVRWHGEGEPIVMEKATIRGVESFGMICAADEIGLAERFPKKDEREIVDLSGMNVKPGTPLVEALELNDVIFEIDNKSLSHRPDLWGHYGIAREVAVLFNREVSKYPNTKIKPGKGLSIKAAVENKNDCPRYSAVAITGLAPTVSPVWLQNALKAVGVRPINTVVDATNYVMHDLGQPLHAFDAALVDKNHQAQSASWRTKHIVVRRASDGERLVTLDGVERVLDEGMLVVADSERVLALAGVMGGLESGITYSTTTAIIESATFNPGLIRAASGRFSLRSDASMRFEKSLDPNLCAVALERVVALLLELHPGATVASTVVDQYGVVRKPQTLEMPLSLFEQKIGAAIPEKSIEQTLVRLGFNVTIKKKTVVLKVPTWRGGKDIVLPEDVIEEVLRFYGYDHVAAALPVFPMTPPTMQPLNMLKRMVARMLATELGYTEVYTYSFVSGEQIKRLGDDVVQRGSNITEER
jgi:phenylalanyl-tRNA synthetase beta chain